VTKISPLFWNCQPYSPWNRLLPA